MPSRREILYTGLTGISSLTAGCGTFSNDRESRSPSDSSNRDLWPSFGSDPQNTAHKPAARAPTENVAVEWRYRVGPEQQATPVVASLGDDWPPIVFVWGHNAGLYALNTTSGEVIWQWFPGSLNENFQRIQGIFATPTVRDGRIYAGSGGNTTKVFAVDPAGQTKWGFLTNAATYSPPTVSTDTVFIGTAVGETAVYALQRYPDTSTGSQRWKVTLDGWARAAPAVADGLVYVACRDHRIYAFDAQTGDEEWSVTTGGMVVSAPTVAAGTVFAGSHDGFIYALDAATGDEQWAFETGGPIPGSPAVANGTVYVGSHDGHVYAINAEEGAEEWSTNTEGKVTASPAVAAETVYVGSQDHRLYALDAETGNERWTFETSGPIYEGVAVADRRVYLVSGDGNLYVLAAN